MWTVPMEVMQLIPREVKALLGVAGGQQISVRRNFDLYDCCAGRARIMRWALMAGLQGRAIDRGYAAHMDLCTIEGYALALVALLRVRPGGLAFFAAQCSSWVWIGRSSTGNPSSS